ncbi:nuclear transport factor 2 family protein [Bryobacter aggregatus]|uniref:nuclear transport factor 2 family protein n=1 Tax=Bryobacter aggregatus TaxID=360054 RepID=UPI0004E0D351|nr:nuclear transport factor 2 family protein [Bryobacter aggregatus]
MANIAALNQKLDDMVLAGKALEAFDELYAEDVVMQENSDAPFVGKAFNRNREIEFFSSIAELHSAAVLSSATSGDVSFSEWQMDITFKNGHRMTLSQVAVRRWSNGLIVNERFYYNKG